jgi:tetratricopeptide (TPR) repeat protein
MSFRVSRWGIAAMLCLLLAASAWPQKSSPSGGQVLQQRGGAIPEITKEPTPGGLLVAVFGENKAALDRQAVVKAVNKESQKVAWETTTGKSQASFENLSAGLYDIEVSAVGYLTAKLGVEIKDADNLYKIDVELKKDPAAIDLNVPSEQQLPAKARKEISQAVADLNSGKLKDALKRLRAANDVVPNNPEVKFLLGYAFFQEKDLQESETYLDAAATLDPRNIQALTLLGRLQMQRQDYGAARKTLEQATTADPENWTAHSLLAETYLKQHENEKAREQAQLAIDKGKGAGDSAEIVLGQALENLGRNQDALQAYRNFVVGSPSSPMAAQAHTMFDDLQRRISNSSGNSAAVPKAASSASPTDALLTPSEPALAVKAWGPPGIDEVRPQVAAGVTCPFDQVIDGVGERVKQLLDDIAQFSAIEDLLHEDLDALGHPITRTTLKFNYLASISEKKPGVFSVDEFRNPNVDEFPGQIATRGLPSLALIFHPDERDDFNMACEGLGDWHGEATWLVRFQQREDRPHRVQEYRINGYSYSISLKGRAWISANTFHLVHLESDLISPMPEIKLLSEHLVIDYNPQLFHKKSVELWLPKNAEIYFDFRGHRYLRRHSFDHFMMFSVDSEEKPKVPSVADEPPAAPQ